MDWLRKFFSNTNDDRDVPNFIKEYRLSTKKIESSLEINKLRVVCFDSESTSLDLKSAQLLSLGAVPIQRMEIDVSDSFNMFVKLDSTQKPENVEIHGITNRQGKAGVSEEQIIQSFFEYITGSILVAHNILFDQSLFELTVAKHYGKVKLVNPMLDTAQLAIRLEIPRANRWNYYPDDFTLDALMERYQIKPLERHSALGDAYCTALLFLKLISKLKKRGIVSLNQFF